MSAGRSREDLMKFLDWLGAKGLMPSSSIANRKAAVGKVLSILPEEEATDVLALDVDEVMTRFSNLHRQDYSPGSLNAYRSRLRSTLDEFEAYLTNPLGYRPNAQARERKASGSKSEMAGNNGGRAAQKAPPAKAEAPGATNIMPIQIRPDLTIRIQGLPFDLTQAEAKRIANVVMAMATLE